MDPESEEDGGLQATTDDTWSSDETSLDPDARDTGHSTDWHHDSVIQPTGWRASRRRQRMPRTPLGWAAWCVAVVVVLGLAGSFWAANGPREAAVPDSAPVDPALVRTEAASACDVAASSVSAPDAWSHGDVEDPLADGQMVFYDVPVSDGSATATVVLADYGDGWEESGTSCDR